MILKHIDIEKRTETYTAVAAAHRNADGGISATDIRGQSVFEARKPTEHDIFELLSNTGELITSFECSVGPREILFLREWHAAYAETDNGLSKHRILIAATLSHTSIRNWLLVNNWHNIKETGKPLVIEPRTIKEFQGHWAEEQNYTSTHARDDRVKVCIKELRL